MRQQGGDDEGHLREGDQCGRDPQHHQGAGVGAHLEP